MSETKDIGAIIGGVAQALSKPHQSVPPCANQCPGASLPDHKRWWCGNPVKQWVKNNTTYHAALCDGCGFREHEYNLDRQQREPGARAGRRGMR